MCSLPCQLSTGWRRLANEMKCQLKCSAHFNLLLDCESKTTRWWLLEWKFPQAKSTSSVQLQPPSLPLSYFPLHLSWGERERDWPSDRRFSATLAELSATPTGSGGTTPSFESGQGYHDSLHMWFKSWIQCRDRWMRLFMSFFTSFFQKDLMSNSQLSIPAWKLNDR